MRPLERKFERAGYKTLRLVYPSRRQSLAKIVDGVSPQIVDFANSLDGDVHFVGHSLGGLVIRAFLAQYRLCNLGRVVMLSTPHAGSEWADLVTKVRAGPLILGPVGSHLTTKRRAEDEALLGHITYPLGIIAGDTSLRRVMPPLIPKPNDSTVSVEATKVRGMSDHIVLPVTHAVMPYHRRVTAQVMAFVRDGAFVR
jgi:pimeloyl-ACP methyl ester carboxylesterase